MSLEKLNSLDELEKTMLLYIVNTKVPRILPYEIDYELLGYFKYHKLKELLNNVESQVNEEGLIVLNKLKVKLNMDSK
jgi:hypothetical protein